MYLKIFKTLLELNPYLILQTKEDRKYASSKDTFSLQVGTNLLSSAIVRITFFPAFDDLYIRKFLFFV